jgi:hypothetical protein
MFSRKLSNDGADHHLLAQDKDKNEELSRDTTWEQSSSTSDRNVSSSSEIWEQDPLYDESHELQDIPVPESRSRAEGSKGDRPKRARIQPEDHGEAAIDLDQEFNRIFSPVR